VLHGTGVTINNIAFYGVGGGIPVTPFGAWSYDFSEEQARTLLADCPQDGILVTHSPPKGAVDLSAQGESLGSSAIRETIERVRPKLVGCGHVHGSAGQQAVIGATSIVNAGPRGIDWQLGESD
jgi:Icc-related predicted phosphoesterase